MTKIAVIGIAGESVFLSVERFGAIGETITATALHKELGGKGFNQAIAAARYGAEVFFLAAAHEQDAQAFTRIAQENGIIAHFAKKQVRSPYAVVTTDVLGQNCVSVYRGAELSVQDVEAFADFIARAHVLLLTNETPLCVNQKAVEIAKAHGVKVLLNPAPARSYDKTFLNQIDIFTPNEHETDGLEAYQNVVVTLGENGYLIKETGKIYPAEKVQTLDTTGAGDTFNGVLAACLANSEALETACKTASIASAIKVSRKYILNSIPYKREIEEYQEKKRNG